MIDERTLALPEPELMTRETLIRMRNRLLKLQETVRAEYMTAARKRDISVKAGELHKDCRRIKAVIVDIDQRLPNLVARPVVRPKPFDIDDLLK